jgi:hypothetical protein
MQVVSSISGARPMLGWSSPDLSLVGKWSLGEAVAVLRHPVTPPRPVPTSASDPGRRHEAA